METQAMQHLWSSSTSYRLQNMRKQWKNLANSQKQTMVQRQDNQQRHKIASIIIPTQNNDDFIFLKSSLFILYIIKGSRATTPRFLFYMLSSSTPKTTSSLSVALASARLSSCFFIIPLSNTFMVINIAPDVISHVTG